MIKLEEAYILPLTSNAYAGVVFKIPNLKFVESQNKLLEFPNGFDP